MLTVEVMAWLALAILWVNTLLVAAAALKELAALGARLRAMAPVWKARVVRGDGRTGAIAGHRVDQIGRAGRDDRAEIILFADQRTAGEIYGGLVETTGDGGAAREIAVEPAIEAEVWVSMGEMRAAATCPSAARFDEAFAFARKARGYSRTVETMIREGATVWLAGEAPAAEQGDTIATAWISSVDPRAFCRSRQVMLGAFAAGILAVAAGCTAVALAPPAFGTVSKIGAAMCLAFFLLVQPAGTALRDAARVPSRAVLRGRWRRPM
jgi:hypothetical protein